MRAGRVQYQWVIVLLTIIGLGVSGCGFQPLYGTNSNLDGADGSALASIEVGQITNQNENRMVALDVRNALIDLLSAHGQADPAYRLDVDLFESLQGIAVQQDATTTRFNYLLNADFKLHDNNTARLACAGQARIVSAYNVVDSEFATVTSRRNAETRAAQTISERIKLRLSVHFRNPEERCGLTEAERKEKEAKEKAEAEQAAEAAKDRESDTEKDRTETQ